MQFIKLILANLRLSALRILQQLLIIPLYLKHPLFRCDLQYFFHYWNLNPYRVCKKHFEKSSQNDVLYGDTWPFSVPHFIRFLPIKSNDVLFEVGSGIGRISFWFQIISGCEVVAIEKVPFFNQVARKIQKHLNLKKVQFLEQDFLEVDYSRASVIYFYGSSFPDEIIYQLIDRWACLKPGTRIISTSFALNEYCSESIFHVLKTFSVSYPWGTCQVFLQVKQ